MYKNQTRYMCKHNKEAIDSIESVASATNFPFVFVICCPADSDKLYALQITQCTIKIFAVFYDHFLCRTCFFNI